MDGKTKDIIRKPLPVKMSPVTAKKPSRWKRFWNWFLGKREESPPPNPEEVGGGMTVTLDKVLRRLDPTSSIPNAVRTNAIRTLTMMANREMNNAVRMRDRKKAESISSALRDAETKFPKAFESLGQADKSALQGQKDRMASRVARMNNKLQNSQGNASNYGVVKDPDTEKRKEKFGKKTGL